MIRSSLLLIPLLLCPVTLEAQDHDVTLLPGWGDDPPVIESLIAFDRGASDLRSAVRRYLEDEDAIERRYPVRFSPRRTERLQEFHQGWQRRLAAVDFSALNHEGQIDYIALSNRLAYSLEMRRLEAERGQEIAALVPFGDGIREL